MAEQQVVGYAMLRMPDGSSIADVSEPITAENVDRYQVDDEVVREAARRLTSLGFTVSESAPATLTIIARKNVFEETFGTSFTERAQEVIDSGTEGGRERYYEPATPIRVPAVLSSLVARIEIPPPPILFH